MLCDTLFSAVEPLSLFTLASIECHPNCLSQGFEFCINYILRLRYRKNNWHNQELIPPPANFVILLRINSANKTFTHALLFTSDLDLPYDLLVDFCSIRFQIVFNFRDAKQFWGFEDFMNVTQTAVANAANPSLFMVDVSWALLSDYRPFNPDFSVLDLKAYFRGYRYVTETIQMLPQKPDYHLVAQLFHKVAGLGLIHPTVQSLFVT